MSRNGEQANRTKEMPRNGELAARADFNAFQDLSEKQTQRLEKQMAAMHDDVSELLKDRVPRESEARRQPLTQTDQVPSDSH